MPDPVAPSKPIAPLPLAGARALPLATGDRALYRALHGDPTVMSFICTPLSIEAADASFDAALRANDHAWPARRTWSVAASEADPPCGIVALVADPDDASAAELGGMFLPIARGRGFVGRSLLAAMRFGFDALGLARLDASHAAAHRGAAAMAGKLGFGRRADLDSASVQRWQVGRDEWGGQRRRREVLPLLEEAAP